MRAAAKYSQAHDDYDKQGLLNCEDRPQSYIASLGGLALKVKHHSSLPGSLLDEALQP